MITLAKVALTLFWICTVMFLMLWIAYVIVCVDTEDNDNNSGRSENDPVSIWNKYKRRK